MVNFIDDQLGRLYQYAHHILDDTMIIMSADHGEMLGDHHRFRKLVPYEASARIPYIIRPPESWGISEGAVCESPVGLQDIMPTILDAVGVDVPETCTGKSLLPVIRKETERVRDLLHGEHAGCYAYELGNQYITDGHHKYIWYTQTGTEHLFNLDEDPNEMHDLSLEAGAETRLGPWREKLIGFLKDRPEGFTDGEKLIVGQEHKNLLPGYDPDQRYAFL